MRVFSDLVKQTKCIVMVETEENTVGVQWTEEQARAIDARGGNLLLSAAAGSGKTTVLVARVMKLIEEGADIDRMLVVTFTNAAASDMRAKLSKKLSEAADKGDKRYRDQMIALEHANISTMHAFCSEFLRTNFERAGVDPEYRILDDAIQRQLLDAALDEVMEEAYAEIDSDESLQTLDYGRGPKGVRALTESFAQTLEERPDPEAWLKRVTDAEIMIPEWLNELKRSAKNTLSRAIVHLREAANLPNCPENYENAMRADIETLRRIQALDDCDALLRALSEFKLTTPKRGKRMDDADREAAERVKDMRAQAKKSIEGIRLLDHPIVTARADAKLLCEEICTLGRLSLRVRDRFEEKKSEQSGLTYADLETCTLRALRDESVAQSVRERFDYVFIDEYQDTSDIQEEIISRISRSDNRFMVGDVKQSIYRFRMAKPRLFIDKFSRYRSGEGGTLIPLTRNFRSKRAILDFVNGVFEKIMIGGDSEITYDALARLNPGAADDGMYCKTEIHILDGQKNADVDPDVAEMVTAERESLFIAHKIREMMNNDATLKFRDFAILTRNKSNTFTPMLPVLLSQNIPAYADGAAGYFESLEIKLATAMLKLIVNRRNDAELIAVLHSPVVGLNAEALAKIRIQSRNTAYIDAAWKYAFGADMPERAEGMQDAIADKLRAFFDLLEHWRLCAGTIGLGELVRMVLNESGFYDYAAALPGGRQRQANLDQLIGDAARYDSEMSGSLSRYLKHAENLRAKGDGDAAHLLGENDDVVRMMTVHKSKGLEFRVVFGALTGKNLGAQRMPDLVSHSDLGVGFLLADPELRTRRKTLPQSAIQERIRREDAAEEMRILYVMLTRAQERLFLVGTVNNIERAKSRFDALAVAPGTGQCYLDWMMASLKCAEKEGREPAGIAVYHAMNDLTSAEGNQQAVSPRERLNAIMREPQLYSDAAMQKNLEWTYPHPEETGKPLKLTVSGLLREVEGPEALPEMVEHPAFMAEEAPTHMTAAERGTAIHRAMQLIDLRQTRGLSGRALFGKVNEMLNVAENSNRIAPAQREVATTRIIVRFLESELGMRMRNAEEVHREWAFNVRMRAAEALTEAEAGRYGAQEILVQGTIDCCFEESGEWVLLDYKTDRADDPEILRAKYQKQVNAYALALERITGKRVKEKYLCLLGANCAISV